MNFINFLLFLNSRISLAAIESDHQPRRCPVYFSCKGISLELVPLVCLERIRENEGCAVSEKTLACYKRDVKVLYQYQYMYKQTTNNKIWLKKESSLKDKQTV